MNPEHAQMHGSYGMVNEFVNGHYGSDVLRDGTRHRFSLCEYCIDYLFSLFKMPPGMEDYMDGKLSRRPWMSAIGEMKQKALRGGESLRNQIVKESERRAAARQTLALARADTACTTCHTPLNNAQVFMDRISFGSNWELSGSYFNVSGKRNDGIILSNVKHPADERRVSAQWLVQNGKEVSGDAIHRDPPDVGYMIALVREQKNVTQWGLAAALEMTAGTLGHIENGTTYFTPEQLDVACKYLHITKEKLFTLAEKFSKDWRRETTRLKEAFQRANPGTERRHAMTALAGHIHTARSNDDAEWALAEFREIAHIKS